MYRTAEAKQGKYTTLHSPRSFTERFGYKFCVRQGLPLSYLFKNQNLHWLSLKNLFSISLFQSVLTKTRNDLKRPTTSKEQSKTSKKRPETKWNDLQRARNDLKRPTTSKKRPETTYNKQETTWNDLQRARNDLKRARNDLKPNETTYNEQEPSWNELKRPTTSKKQPEMTWNDLQRARNDLRWSTKSKIQPKTSKKFG